VGRIVRSDPSTPGITRRRRGDGWTYRDPKGRTLHDERAVARIDALAIPPAWRRVWISPAERGHIQAIGLDASGRRQYVYLPAWVERRQAGKWERVVRFGRALPDVRAEVRSALARPEDSARSPEAALAWAVRLLDHALLRVGGIEYQRSNGTYGLCTLERRHVAVDGDRVTLRFVGKQSLRHEIHLHDAELAEAMGRVVGDGRGRTAPLVGWREHGRWHRVRPAQLNAWLAQRVEGATAKDFRSWHGTVLGAAALVFAERDGAARADAVREMATNVATVLGNTPAVARASYVHPAVVDAWLDGHDIAPAIDAATSLERVSRGELRDVAERAVLDLLDELTPRTMRGHARELLGIGSAA
jgi:DNA topoisomerase IB